MNNFHIYEEVGRGKFSVVYKGRKKKSIEYVAVKSVERSRRRKLMNEVRILHNLSHQNILKFYNWYETRNHLWIIFEYCAAGDLLKIIEEDKKVNEEQVRKFAYELVEGLSYLHSNGIIFSDLKPSNILINEYNILKLCDFGLSKKISDLTLPENDPTKPKAGTPYYMAPELFSENGIHSFYSDFWSLGCLMVELATGKPPFSTNSLKDLITMIIEADFQRVKDFSKEYNDLVSKLLEKDPIKRINWDELKSHPFWTAGKRQYEFTKRLYPPQPQFDIYLQSRGIVPQHFYDQRNNPLAKKFGHPAGQGGAGAKVDILRLSHNVRRNMKKDEEDEQQNQYASAVPQSEISVKFGGGGSSSSTSSSTNNNNQASKGSSSQIGGAFSSSSSQQNVGASSGSSSGNSQQVAEDDIKLNNRNMVLNFGEKEEDEEADPVSSKWQPPSSGTSAGSGSSGGSTPHSGQNLTAKDINFSGQQPHVSGSANQQYLSGKAQQQNLIDLDFTGGNTASDQKVEYIESDQAEILFDKVSVTKEMSKKSAASHNLGSTGTAKALGKQGTGVPTVGGQQPSSSSNRKLNHKQQDDDQMYGMSTNPPKQLYAGGSGMVQQQQNFFQQQQVSAPQNVQVQQNIGGTNAGGIGSKQQYVPQQPYSQKDLALIVNMQMFVTNSSKSNQTGGSSNSNKEIASMSSQQPKVPHKTIEQLIIHNSDTAVKPIIGNKDIEKVVETQYNAQYLTFEPWSSEQIVAKIDSTAIESHLSDVYSAMANNTTMNEKINALLYFESIIVNSNVSNRLINSAFMALLVKMMKTIKSPLIRIRLCSVIGLLIRHSTVIENELAESDICNQLIETMKDKNEKVRKKAIAALGEYLFYAATQLDDEQADPIWEIPDEAINVIIRSLRASEDEIVRFYACKTLENITAQSTSAGHRFATIEAVNYLLALFLTPQNQTQTTLVNGQQQSGVNDNMRTSAAVALSHICKLNPALFPPVFEKITAKQFCIILIDGQSRVQQAFITMLNLALAANAYAKINDVLLNEENFLKSLLRLLEHHSIVIRGKCLLTFLLLFKLDFRWMAIVDQEVKFYHVLDRLTRDNYKYVQCCLLCLVNGINEIIPTIFKTIADELSTVLNGGKPAIRAPSDFDKLISKQQFEHLQGNLIYISIILDLQNAQVIRNRIVDASFIRCIAALIDNCDIYSFQGAEDFINALLLITESMSSNKKVLLQMNEAILAYMLPVLLAKIKSESADIRFLSLKLFTDIIIQYIHDDSIYDLKYVELTAAQQQLISNITYEQQSIRATTKQINDLILKNLLPSFPIILADNEPVPLFGLRLLSAIIERNTKFVVLLKQFNLFNMIADFYSVNHPKLNRHTIMILKSMVESKELTFQELSQLRIIEKTTLIIKDMLASKQGEWCIEILLDIIHEILTQFNDVVKTREGELTKQIDEIFNNFDVCVQLLNLNFEINIVEKSSQCLIQMLQLYALCQQKKREVFFVEQHMQFLVAALKTDKKIIQKRLLKCIYWALIQTEYQIKMPNDKRIALEQQIHHLMQSDDRSIGNTSREILKILQETSNTGVGGGGLLLGNTDTHLNNDSSAQLNYYHQSK